MLLDIMPQWMRILIRLVQNRFSLKSADLDQMLLAAAMLRSPVVELMLVEAGAVCKVEVVAKMADSLKMQVEATSNNVEERVATLPLKGVDKHKLSEIDRKEVFSRPSHRKCRLYIIHTNFSACFLLPFFDLQRYTLIRLSTDGLCDVYNSAFSWVWKSHLIFESILCASKRGKLWGVDGMYLHDCVLRKARYETKLGR